MVESHLYCTQFRGYLQNIGFSFVISCFNLLSIQNSIFREHWIIIVNIFFVSVEINEAATIYSDILFPSSNLFQENHANFSWTLHYFRFLLRFLHLFLLLEFLLLIRNSETVSHLQKILIRGFIQMDIKSVQFSDRLELWNFLVSFFKNLKSQV